jgi:DNA mismatch repair protein MutS
LEYDVFLQLRDLVANAAARLQSTANALAEIDVLASLAELARSRNYVRPTVVAEPVLDIEAGRHPVLDITEAEGTFVPNGVQCAARGLGAGGWGLDANNLSSVPSPETPVPGSLLLITGPNMAGKSTYIRQCALLTLLAQMGSFVPARRAVIGVADRIFARVGASDELSRGQSTFMVEMTETARILNTATRQSLVILDEIGRGTSTYDGLSLAWSIVEHIHDCVGCRTLFATHYHELTDLEEQLAGVRNYNVAVKEWEDQVVFLHQIVPGAADKSYGIHVAQLAGVPSCVNERAREVLAWLEAQHDAHETPAACGLARTTETARKMSHNSNGNGSSTPWQLTLFGLEEHPLLDEIRSANLDEVSPSDALEILRNWQERLVADHAAGGRRL